MLKPEAPPPGDPLAEDPDGKVNRPGPDRTCHSENRHETNTVTIAQATARWHLRWAWCSSKCLAWVTPLALPTGLGADRIVTHSLRIGGARISWRPEVRAQWQPLTSGVHRCPESRSDPWPHGESEARSPSVAPGVPVHGGRVPGQDARRHLSRGPQAEVRTLALPPPAGRLGPVTQRQVHGQCLLPPPPRQRPSLKEKSQIPST